MIKINLLPVAKARKVRKQAELRSQVVLGVLVLFFVGMICAYKWVDLNNKISGLNDKKGKVEKELTVLKEKVKEVEGYEENKKTLQEKNRIIEQLKRNQSGPVHILDEISASLEPLKLWLNDLNITGRSVVLNGKAVSNSDIVEFVSNLKKSKYFSGVELVESRKLEEKGVSIYRFRVKSSLVL